MLLTLKEGALQVLLSQRRNEPFRSVFALPGGYIHAQEDLHAEDAARRVLRAKTGLSSPYLEQLAAFTGPGRDPRGWSVSVAYYALISAQLLECGSLVAEVTERRLKESGETGAGGGSERSVKGEPEKTQLFSIADLPSLPFDHRQIVSTAVARLRSKSFYSSLPVYLCQELFSLPELQETYEAVLGEAINKVSFRRKIHEMGILEEAGDRRGGAHRPAKLYRLRAEFRERLSLVERGLNRG